MYYVYTYTDPLSDEIIYVGKGQAYRHKEHLRKSHNKGSESSNFSTASPR